MNFTTDDGGCVRYTSEPQCKCKCAEDRGATQAPDPGTIHEVANAAVISKLQSHLGIYPDPTATATDAALAYLRSVVEDKGAWPTDRIKAAELLLGL